MRPPPENPSPDSTLLDRIERRARDRPSAPAFLFEEREVTIGELWESTGRFAALVAAHDLGPGDRVVLVLPNGPDFFAAFYGAQRAGAVPVPIYPQSGVERVARIAELSAASLVVLDPAAPEQNLAAVRARLGADGPAVVAELEGPGAPPPLGPPLDGDLAGRPALIQYTSGSTGAPKGVVIPHGHLVTNVRQMIAGMEITADDVFVSWLPVHHDMGLVLMTMVPFSLGARLVLLPSSLGDVRAWLRAVERYGGTFTAAPDFAYRLCLRAVRDPSAFDLGSLRVALNAAEPVRAETIRRFEEAFGLDRVMVAGYGLAEATVGVSMQPPGTAPVVSERGLVSIGRPFPEVSVRIMVGRAEAAPGEVGEVVVESPANTPGYFRDPEATAELFRHPGAIATGDLGFRDGAGHVFLVGRTKNIILQAGRNLAPQELEEAAEALPFVRRAAAVGVDRGGAAGEQAYVFAELRRAKPPAADRLHAMATDVVARVHERLGLRPGRVILLEPRTIPRTANGKIRHAALREAYLGGAMRERIFLE